MESIHRSRSAFGNEPVLFDTGLPSVKMNSAGIPRSRGERSSARAAGSAANRSLLPCSRPFSKTYGDKLSIDQRRVSDATQAILADNSFRQSAINQTHYGDVERSSCAARRTSTGFPRRHFSFLKQGNSPTGRQAGPQPLATPRRVPNEGGSCKPALHQLDERGRLQ